MSTRGYAFAPPAFNVFCLKQRSLCSTSGGAKVVALSAARKSQLQRVNSSVNARISQRSDLSTTGKEDDWVLPTRQGDCEDIAILKKSELLKLG